MTATDKATPRPLDALLTCPFCGGEATIDECEITGLFDVTCTADGCTVCVTAKRLDGAIEAWNRRAALPVPAGAVEALDVLQWVETWVSNPVTSYSVSALDGLFAMTRERIAAIAASRPAGEAKAEDDDPVCTGCGGTGICYQTERICACQPPAPSPSTAGDEVQGMVDKADAWDAITEKNRRIAAFDKLVAKLEASVEELSEQNAALTARAEKADSDISAAIGSTRFMDPPDGGSVTLPEQVTRMRQALKEAERERDEAYTIIGRQGDSIMEWNPLCQASATEIIQWQGRAEASRALLAEAAEGLDEAFDFLGGVDGAAEIRGRVLELVTKLKGAL